MKKKIFIVIPAHYEERYIGSVIAKARKYADNVIVVDDGSSDNTGKEASKNGAVVLSHVVNLGKGAALKTGCDYAIMEKADIIIALDADAQHDPKEIPNFVRALENADVALGCRKINRRMPFVLRFGNWFIDETIKFLYGLRIRDSQCGYRAFTPYAYQKLRWKSSDYSMESEMIARIGRKKMRYAEVPIETIYSDKYKGTTIIDGVKIVINLLLWRLSRL